MKKSTKRWAMIIAVVLAALMLFSFVFSVFTNFAVAATTIDSLKEQQKIIAADKKRIAEKRADTIKEKKSKINQKFALDEQIAVTEQEIENTTLLISEYTLQIAETETKLISATEELAEKEASFLLRMRAMEEAGDVNYISILMQASSFSDLLGRIEIINEIAEYDRGVIEELQAAREQITEARIQLELEKNEQLESRKLLSDVQAELAEQYRELDQMIADLEADEKEYAEAEEKAEKEMEDFNKQIQKIIAEQARKNTVYVGGTFLWPAPEYTRVSSEFGWRFHPVLKVNKYHTGVDLASPTNSPILAANSGTVILAEYNGGYGNCVVIDHGGGVTTLYGHANKLLVKKGQSVTRGDKIALVGSTGTSTGPHLHFEISRNGVRENPLTKNGIGTKAN